MSGGSDGKESACSAGEPGWQDPLGKRMATHTTHTLFLPGGFHGQRNLPDYSPWGPKELDTTERLALSHTQWEGSKVLVDDCYCSFFSYYGNESLSRSH